MAGKEFNKGYVLNSATENDRQFSKVIIQQQFYSPIPISFSFL